MLKYQDKSERNNEIYEAYFDPDRKESYNSLSRKYNITPQRIASIVKREEKKHETN